MLVVLRLRALTRLLVVLHHALSVQLLGFGVKLHLDLTCFEAACVDFAGVDELAVWLLFLFFLFLLFLLFCLACLGTTIVEIICEQLASVLILLLDYDFGEAALVYKRSVFEV